MPFWAAFSGWVLPGIGFGSVRLRGWLLCALASVSRFGDDAQEPWVAEHEALVALPVLPRPSVDSEGAGEADAVAALDRVGDGLGVAVPKVDLQPDRFAVVVPLLGLPILASGSRTH